MNPNRVATAFTRSIETVVSPFSAPTEKENVGARVAPSRGQLRSGTRRQLCRPPKIGSTEAARIRPGTLRRECRDHRGSDTDDHDGCNGDAPWLQRTDHARHPELRMRVRVDVAQ